MRLAARILPLALAGCGLQTPEVIDDGPLALRQAVDINPDPDVVEIELVAEAAAWEYMPGRQAEVLAYRDANDPEGAASIPGPLLRGKLGDEVIVHFTNAMDVPTTIHWHGLKVPSAADGTHASQHPIAPGATFEYRYPLTDVGTFWYHPHVDGERQIEAGLYAPLIVDGGLWVDTDADRMFVLDDVKLEASGVLSERTTTLDMMMGRQGNMVVVNGRSEAHITTQSGARERWRFVNSANGRFFQLQLPGHEFTVLGSDGGMYGEPVVTDTVLIAPGERYDIVVWLQDEPGQALWLQTLHYDRGHDIPDPGPKRLFEVRFDGESHAPLGELPAMLGATVPLVVPPEARLRTMVMSEEEPEVLGGEPRFFFNGKGGTDIPDQVAALGDLEIWELENDSEMDHPFHLHGTFFQVLDVDGVAPETLAWKDTVNVPREASLRFAVRFDNPGVWMYHCHILEHAERGMMGRVRVNVP